jgi:phosphoribosyl 1,2-cyclic phosphodiesterase
MLFACCQLNGALSRRGSTGVGVTHIYKKERNALEKQTTIVFLGTRGSVPTDGPAFARYGGATSCVLVKTEDAFVFLDAGSGILRAAPHLAGRERRVSVLLSHAHIDHVLGLLAFPPLYAPDFEADVYAADRDGLSTKEQIERLMSPPLWPTGPAAFADTVRFLAARPHFQIGDLEVDATEGNHPGGALVYRLSRGDKSLVYCTDFEHGEEASARLAAFAADCDLLVYDAQYSDAEYEQKRGFGHSTWEEGVKLAKRCRAARAVLFHHDPSHDDETLARAEAECQKTFDKLSFAKCGEVISL